MIDHKTQEQCRKILTYGMCLDMIQDSTVQTKRRHVLTPRNVNKIYQQFTRAVQRRNRH